MKTTPHLALAILAAACLGSTAFNASAQPDDISWKTIANGGGTLTDQPSGGFRLTGTIGQHTLGVMTGGSFEMVGGFWAEDASAFCLADFNQDLEVNPDDLADFIGCYFALPACDRADYNEDGTINPDDLADYIGDYFTLPDCTLN